MLGIAIFVVLLVVLESLTPSVVNNQQSATNSTDSDMLKGDVTPNSLGLLIKNNESDDWTDCMVGINNPDGWDFNKPPFKTHTPFVVPAQKSKFITYANITSDDGTQFDIATHTINSAIVACFPSSSTRYWLATFTH